MSWQPAAIIASDLKSMVQPPAPAAVLRVHYLISAVQLAECVQGPSATQISQKLGFQSSGCEPWRKKKELSAGNLCSQPQHPCCHKGIIQ